MNDNVWKGALAVGTLIGGFIGYQKGRSDACDKMSSSLESIRESSFSDGMANIGKEFLSSVEGRNGLIEEAANKISTFFTK